MQKSVKWLKVVTVNKQLQISVVGDQLYLDLGAKHG